MTNREIMESRLGEFKDDFPVDCPLEDECDSGANNTMDNAVKAAISIMSKMNETDFWVLMNEAKKLGYTLHAEPILQDDPEGRN